MQKKKSPEFDLMLSYRKTFERATIIALVVALLGFHGLRQVTFDEIELEKPDIVLTIEEVPPTEQIKRPPRPMRPQVPVPTESEDVPEDETILTTELDFSDIPPPPEEPPMQEDSEGFVFVAFDEPPKMIGGMAKLMSIMHYPELARKAGVEARVIMGVQVDEQGNTTKVIVMKSNAPNMGFEDAASKALKQMRWKPAFQRDRAVKVWISIPVTFTLKMKSPDDVT